MADVTIEYEESTDQFIIKLDPSGTTEEWVQLLGHWAPRNVATPPTRVSGIPVSQDDLIGNFSWFRTNWMGHRGDVVPSSRVRSLLLERRGVKEEFEQILRFGPASNSIPIIQPVKRPLKPFQEANVRLLLGMRNGANFSVPGAGKTAMTVSLWSALVKNKDLDQLLVVAPKSAFESWTSELEVFGASSQFVDTYEGGPVPPSQVVVITNYEQLQLPKNVKDLLTWARRRPTMMVLDEAHRVKGGPGKTRWDACNELTKAARRVDVLTGTPMPQGPNDVRNIFRLAWPGLQATDLDDGTVARMKRNLTFVRTTKQELGLPEYSPTLFEHEMSDLQKEIYRALRRQFSGLFKLDARDAANLNRRGRAVMTLLACASNPALLSKKDDLSSLLGFTWPPRGFVGGENLMDLIEAYAWTEMPWKFQWLAAYSDRLLKQNKKLLVWTNFIGNIKSLEKVLKPVGATSVFGQHSNEERAESLRRFRKDSDCGVLITNAQTLGEGISLHDVCHDSVYLDRSFNAGLYLQSVDRIHRLGLSAETETNVTFLTSKDSIDENVNQRLEIKVARMGQLLDDVGLVATSSVAPYDPLDDVLGINDILDLDNDDLNSLFGHMED